MLSRVNPLQSKNKKYSRVQTATSKVNQDNIRSREDVDDFGTMSLRQG